MFSTSKDKIDDVYTSLQDYFNIDDYVELNKYIGIDPEHWPDGSIHIRKPYLTQIIINMIPGIKKLSATPTPAVKPPIEKRGIPNEQKWL